MEDFVTYELAVKLKEKGYPQHICDYAYITEDDYEANKYVVGDREYIPFIPDYLPTIAAPIISQVLKWLREECKIFILIEPDILSPEYKLTFTLRVKFYISGEEDEGFIEKYLTYRRDSYELAAIAGIEYVLDNLI